MLPPKGFQPLLMKIVIPSQDIILGGERVDDIWRQVFEVVNHRITVPKSSVVGMTPIRTKAKQSFIPYQQEEGRGREEKMSRHWMYMKSFP